MYCAPNRAAVQHAVSAKNSLKAETPAFARQHHCHLRVALPHRQSVAQKQHIETKATKYGVSTATVKPKEQYQALQPGGCNCPTPCGGSGTVPTQTTGRHSILQSGPLLLTAGAFVCSFISLQIKLFEHPLPPFQVTAFSSAVAWLATSAIMKGTGMSTTGGCQAKTFESVTLLMLRGMLGAAAVGCYYSAIEELPLPVAVALFFFNPIFAVIMDAAVSSRRIPPQALGSCVLTVLGVLMIGWHDQILWHIEQLVGLAGPASSSTAAAAAAGAPVTDLPIGGVLMGLAAAAANAAAFVSVGIIGPGVSPLCLTWWQHLVVTHVAVAVVLFKNLEPLGFRLGSSSLGSNLGSIGSSSSGSGGGSIGAWADAAAGGLLVDIQDALGDLQGLLPSQHDALLLMGVVTANFCGQLLLNAGFQRMDAGRGSAINASQVMFGCLWDVLLLHSAPSSATWVGAGAIAAGVLGTTVSPPEEEKGAEQ